MRIANISQPGVREEGSADGPGWEALRRGLLWAVPLTSCFLSFVICRMGKKINGTFLFGIA